MWKLTFSYKNVLNFGFDRENSERFKFAIKKAHLLGTPLFVQGFIVLSYGFPFQVLFLHLLHFFPLLFGENVFMHFL